MSSKYGQHNAHADYRRILAGGSVKMDTTPGEYIEMKQRDKKRALVIINKLREFTGNYSFKLTTEAKQTELNIKKLKDKLQTINKKISLADAAELKLHKIDVSTLVILEKKISTVKPITVITNILDY